MLSALAPAATSAAMLLLGLLIAVALALLVARRRGWRPRAHAGGRHELGIRVVDVKWLAGRAGCALLEVGQQRFLVPIGEARTPLPLASSASAARAAEERGVDA